MHALCLVELGFDKVGSRRALPPMCSLADQNSDQADDTGFPTTSHPEQLTEVEARSNGIVCGRDGSSGFPKDTADSKRATKGDMPLSGADPSFPLSPDPEEPPSSGLLQLTRNT